MTLIMMKSCHSLMMLSRIINKGNNIMEDSVKIILSLILIVIVALVVIALIKVILANLGIVAAILLGGLVLAALIGKK